MSAYKLMQFLPAGGQYRATTRTYSTRAEAYAHAETLHQTDDTPIVAVRVKAGAPDEVVGELLPDSYDTLGLGHAAEWRW